MKKCFYDIHVHVLNLSHPKLSAFLSPEKILKKLIGGSSDSKKKLWKSFLNLFSFLLFPAIALIIAVIAMLWIIGLTIWWFIFIKKPYMWYIKFKVFNRILSWKFIDKMIKKIFNTLQFFEIPMEYQFLVLDHTLRPPANKNAEQGQQITIGNTAYDKIVLCPLVIDFGYKDIPKDDKFNYSLTPKRPVVNQIGDLLYSIRTYYRFNLVIDEKNRKMDISDEIEHFETIEKKQEKLFEIYPFMGLDTRNYTLHDVKKMLLKYFKNFNNEPADERRKRLMEKMGKLDSNMYGDKNNSIDYADIFAGIKVYPQLGFDPYPETDSDLSKVILTEELDKEKDEQLDSQLNRVRFLYQFCCERRIPIITHCSDGGYKTGDNDGLTAPEKKWKKVLEEYPDLTLNFAHFGAQSNSVKPQWRDAIIELSKRYPNVYTDISCNDSESKYYTTLEGLLNNPSHSELHKKVLFGSDFSINLLVTKVESYSDYLQAFGEAGLTHQSDLCEKNPEKFLFG